MNAFVSLAVPLERVAVSVTLVFPSAKAGRTTSPSFEITAVLLELHFTETSPTFAGRVIS